MGKFPTNSPGFHGRWTDTCRLNAGGGSSPEARKTPAFRGGNQVILEGFLLCAVKLATGFMIFFLVQEKKVGRAKCFGDLKRVTESKS